jgi:hypothetical protein
VVLEFCFGGCLGVDRRNGVVGLHAKRYMVVQAASFPRSGRAFCEQGFAQEIVRVGNLGEGGSSNCVGCGSKRGQLAWEVMEDLSASLHWAYSGSRAEACAAEVVLTLHAESACDDVVEGRDCSFEVEILEVR